MAATNVLWVPRAGLVEVTMSIIAAMLTMLTIAHEWERGTIEQLASTPVHQLEVVFGMLLPYVVIGPIGAAMVAAADIVIFDVPFRGSVNSLLSLEASTSQRGGR